MMPKAAPALAVALVLQSASLVRADDTSVRLDDEFMRQSAGQIALAAQAQQCQLRSSVWLNKLVSAVRQRLSEHFRKVRPTWDEGESNSVARQVIYGAFHGAIAGTGAPAIDSTDFMKQGEEMLSKSMACQVVTYKKSELLYLDNITDGGGS